MEKPVHGTYSVPRVHLAECGLASDLPWKSARPPPGPSWLQACKSGSRALALETFLRSLLTYDTHLRYFTSSFTKYIHPFIRPATSTEPASTLTAGIIMSVTLHTSLGNVKVEIFCESVPKTAEVRLAKQTRAFNTAVQFLTQIPTRTFSPSALPVTTTSRPFTV